MLGTIEILPMETALTVFAWSKSRVMPVRMTDFRSPKRPLTVTESDSREGLPGHARADVNDLGFQSPAGAMYMIYQTTKEALAQHA